jgi:Amt family ammonium transporter
MVWPAGCRAGSLVCIRHHRPSPGLYGLPGHIRDYYSGPLDGSGCGADKIQFAAGLCSTVVHRGLLPRSGGWLAKLGALDFAGGTVVHVNAGISAIALALVLGPRRGFAEKETMEPNNIPYVVLGAGLLWFGWFGFNAGSALTAGGLAANAFIVTNTSAAAAGFTWMVLGWIHRRPSALGAATGAVVGLVAITPAAGYVPVWAGIPIGAIASIISYYVMVWRAKSSRLDESLDVFACHGMGGTWGAIATGIFATTAVNPAGSGLLDGNWKQMFIQLAAIAATMVYAFVVSWILAQVLKRTMGMRVKDEEEAVGLDISQHGERAYGGI